MNTQSSISFVLSRFAVALTAAVSLCVLSLLLTIGYRA